jgi:hypothetical protein
VIPRLQIVGDTEEQQHWPHLQTVIPHYESFWAKYVFPLRSEGAIWFKQGIDPRFERMAIASYSAFTALARARFKIFEDHEDYRHVEELYIHLQRAGEVGVKMVKEFNDIDISLLGHVRSVNVSQLETLIESRLKQYRNLVHDVKRAMPKGERGRMIPKPEKLLEYAQWSQTMFHFREEDFVSAESQVTGDFFATAAALEAAWKVMSGAYDTLSVKSEFQRALHQGDSTLVASSAVPTAASGSFSIGRPASAGDDPDVFPILPLPKRK